MPGGRDPLRSCCGCGAKRPKEELLRVVAGPEGNAVIDPRGKLPGRGTYVCYRRSCMEKAGGRLPAKLKVKRLGEAGGEELARKAAAALESRALSLMGLARRGGSVVAGTNMAEGALRRRSLPAGMLLLVAGDASPRVVAGVRTRAEALGVAVEQFLGREALGDAVGKSPRSVVLVTDPGLAGEIREAIGRHRAVHVREV